MTTQEFTVVKPKESTSAYYERLRSRRLNARAKLERTIRRVEADREYYANAHVLATARWARAGGAGNAPQEDPKVPKLVATLKRLRASLASYGKESRKEFQLRWSVKTARISRQARMKKLRERAEKERYNRFALLSVDPDVKYEEYDGPALPAKKSKRSLEKAAARASRYDKLCTGPFLGLKKSAPTRPKLSFVEMLERSFWAYNLRAHTLIPLAGTKMCYLSLLRDLFTAKLRQSEIVPQMRIPLISDLLGTMSNLNDITKNVKTASGQMAKINVDDIVGATVHSVGEAAKEAGLFMKVWAVISNIVHVLISPTWKTAVWAVVSLLQSLFNVKWDRMDKLIKYFSILFMRARIWAGAGDIPPPFRTETMNARPQMAEQDDSDEIDGANCDGPQYGDDESIMKKHAGAIVTIIIASIVTGLGFASSKFAQEGNWAARIIQLVKSFTTTANGLLTFFRGTIELFKDIYELIMCKYFPNYESLSFLSKNDDQIYEWAKRAQILLDHRNRHVIFSNPVRVAELYATANEACLIQAKLIKCDMGLKSSQFSILSRLISDTLRLRDVAAGLHVAPPVKFEPFVLQLCGKANIGKSFLLNTFTVDLLHKVGYRTYQEPIYVRAPGNAYWNSLANQPICIYDDFMALTTPEFSSVQIAELFQLKTRSVFNPPMAAVDDKTIRYNPIIVGIASNASHYNLSGVLDSDAIHRRRDCLIEMKLKECYTDIHAVPKGVLMKNEHLEFDILDPIKPNVKHHAGLSYEEFSRIVQDRFNAYYAAETMRYKQVAQDLFRLVPRAGEMEFKFEGHETGEALSTYMERFASIYVKDEHSIKTLMRMVSRLSIRKQKVFYKELASALQNTETKQTLLGHMISIYRSTENLPTNLHVTELIERFSHISYSENADRAKLLKYCVEMSEQVAKSNMPEENPEIKPQAVDPADNIPEEEFRFFRNPDIRKIYKHLNSSPNDDKTKRRNDKARIILALQQWADEEDIEVTISWLRTKELHTKEFDEGYTTLASTINVARLVKLGAAENEKLMEKILDEKSKNIKHGPIEVDPSEASTSTSYTVEEPQVKMEKKPRCIHEKMNQDLMISRVKWNGIVNEWQIEVCPKNYMFEFSFYPQAMVVDSDKGHYIAVAHDACKMDECPWKTTEGRFVFMNRYAEETTFIQMTLETGGYEDLTEFMPNEYILANTVQETTEPPPLEKGFFAKLYDKLKDLPWFKMFKLFSLVLTCLGSLLTVYRFFFKNENANDEPIPQGSNTSDRNKTHSDAPKRAKGPKGKPQWEKPIKMSDLAGQMNANIDDEMSSVVRRNTFFIAMKDPRDGKFIWKTAARCVGIVDRVAMFPAHYMDVWTAIINSGKQISFFYVSNINSAPIEISMKDLVLSRDPNRSLAFMILPKTLNCFRNITGRFSTERDSYSRAISAGIYELQCKSDGTIRFDLQKTRVTARLTQGINVGASGSFRAFRVAASYSYEYGGPGVCGSLLIGDSGRIYGMHVAGSEGRDMGYSEIIGHEEMERAAQLAEFRGEANIDPTILIPDSDERMGSFPSDLSMPVIVSSIGRVPDALRNRSPVDTAFLPSPISQDLAQRGIPSVHTPAVLSTRDSRISHVLSPLLEGVKHHGNPIRPLPARFVENSLADYTNLVLSKTSPFLSQVSILTRSEAIIGVAGNRYIRSLEFTSSSGWPWRCDRSPKAAQKQRWVDVSGFDEGQLYYNGCDPELAAVMDIKDRQRREGIIPFTVFADVLKDETVPHRKIKPGGTRVISMSPIDFTIQQRQYTMSFVAAFMHNRLDLEHAIGIDTDSSEWTSILQKICRNGRKNFIAGDYSKFGDRLPADIGKKCYGLIAQWYAMYLPDDEARLVKQNLSVMAEEVFSPYHIVNDRIYKTMAGMPSGNTVTVILNSMINSILLRVAWCSLTHNTPFAGFTAFHRYVTIFTYGDDMLASVDDEVAHLYNTKTISDFFAEYGLQFTDADKTGRDILFRTLDEVTFLKRSFRPFSPSEMKKTGIRNLVLAPMDLDTVYSVAHWVKKGNDPEEYALLLSHEALKLAFTRGEEEYDRIAAIFRDIWRKRGQHLIVEDWAVLAQRTYVSAIPLMEATRKFISHVESPTVEG